jgi:hypothetical protein
VEGGRLRRVSKMSHLPESPTITRIIFTNHLYDPNIPYDIHRIAISHIYLNVIVSSFQRSLS